MYLCCTRHIGKHHRHISSVTCNVSGTKKNAFDLLLNNPVSKCIITVTFPGLSCKDRLFNILNSSSVSMLSCFMLLSFRWTLSRRNSGLINSASKDSSWLLERSKIYHMSKWMKHCTCKSLDGILSQNQELEIRHIHEGCFWDITDVT